MRHVLSAVVATFLAVVLIVGTAFAASPADSTPVTQDTQACIINVLGIKVCGTLLGQPLPPVVTVTVPPVTLPPIVGPTRTVTVTPEPVRVTETVRPAPVRVTERVSGPTVTASPQPQPTATATVTKSGPTQTATVNPPAATVTVRPNGTPVPTVTETVTVSPPTGQTVSPSDTVEPSKTDEPFTRFDIDLGDESVSAGEAGVGLLGALLILALILGGMFYGFRRGLVASEEEESHFLRKMLDRSKTT